MDLLNKIKARKKQNLNMQCAEEIFDIVSKELSNCYLLHKNDVSLYTIEVNLVLNLLNAHIQSLIHVSEQTADPKIFDYNVAVEKMRRSLDLILKQVGLVTQSIEKEG